MGGIPIMANKKYNFSNPVVFTEKKKEVRLGVRHIAKRQWNWPPQHIDDMFLKQYAEFNISPFGYWYNCRANGIRSVESMAQEIFDCIQNDGGKIHENE